MTGLLQGVLLVGGGMIAVWLLLPLALLLAVSLLYLFLEGPWRRGSRDSF